MKMYLFTSGNNGYHSYRIPSIITTQSETLLAFCEGRRNNRRDHGDIGCLYEAGKETAYDHLVFERFRF